MLVTFVHFSLCFQGSKLLPLVKNVVLTPPDYDRDIRHYEFDLKGTGMTYSPGDCLGRLILQPRLHFEG